MIKGIYQKVYRKYGEELDDKKQQPVALDDVIKRVVDIFITTGGRSDNTSLIEIFGLFMNTAGS